MKIRLALRQEGKFWNAYLAKSDTMDGAKLIGSIAIGAVLNNQTRKNQFQKLMTMVLGDAIKDLTGFEIKDWETEPAPESERAGNA